MSQRNSPVRAGNEDSSKGFDSFLLLPGCQAPLHSIIIPEGEERQERKKSGEAKEEFRNHKASGG